MSSTGLETLQGPGLQQVPSTLRSKAGSELVVAAAGGGVREQQPILRIVSQPVALCWFLPGQWDEFTELASGVLATLSSELSLGEDVSLRSCTNPEAELASGGVLSRL